MQVYTALSLPWTPLPVGPPAYLPPAYLHVTVAPAPAPIVVLPALPVFPAFLYPLPPPSDSPRDAGFGPKAQLYFSSPPRFIGGPSPLESEPSPTPSPPPTAFHHYLETLSELHDLLFNPALPPFPLPERNTRLYRLLGLDPGCSAEAVAARYKQLALAHHPDKGGEAEGVRLKEYNAAKAVLLDAALRQEYDRFRAEDRMCIDCWARAASEHYHGGAAYFRTLAGDLHAAFLCQVGDLPDVFGAGEPENGGGEDPSCDPPVRAGEGRLDPAGSPVGHRYELEIDDEGDTVPAPGSVASPTRSVNRDAAAGPSTALADAEEQLTALWWGAGRIRQRLLQWKDGTHRSKQELEECHDQLCNMMGMLSSLDTLSDSGMLYVHCHRMKAEVAELLAALRIEAAAGNPPPSPGPPLPQASPAPEGPPSEASSQDAGSSPSLSCLAEVPEVKLQVLDRLLQVEAKDPEGSAAIDDPFLLLTPHPGAPPPGPCVNFLCALRGAISALITAHRFGPASPTTATEEAAELLRHFTA
eukprot:EG_transcript_9056